jgi:hypothetical protein
MARMTFETLTAEGRKLSQNLDLMEQIMSDPLTIQEQAKVVRKNGDLTGAKLRAMTKAMDLPCLDCNHGRMDHDNYGKGKCGFGTVSHGVVQHCTCVGWVVEFS